MKDKPDYWEAFAPRVKGLQDIDIWAENSKGAKGHLHVQVLIEYDASTIARLIVTPYIVTLVPDRGGLCCDRINRF